LLDKLFRDYKVSSMSERAYNYIMANEIEVEDEEIDENP
jgi:hypothetical protein